MNKKLSTAKTESVTMIDVTPQSEMLTSNISAFLTSEGIQEKTIVSNSRGVMCFTIHIIVYNSVFFIRLQKAPVFMNAITVNIIRYCILQQCALDSTSYACYIIRMLNTSFVWFGVNMLKFISHDASVALHSNIPVTVWSWWVARAARVW
jgi:hypothetical protein